MKYVLIIAKGSEAYWGHFPDVPGCTTSGNDLDSIAANAVEALGGHLEGEPVPAPRSLVELLADPDVATELDGSEAFVSVEYHGQPVAAA